jgi:hypothetical protein
MSTLGKFAGALIRTALLPVSVLADVVTMGGVLSDKEQSYTGEAIGKIAKDVESGVRELE